MTGSVAGAPAPTTGGAPAPAWATRRTADERAGGMFAATAARRTGSVLARWGSQLSVYGLDRIPGSGGAILAINHTSAVDGPLVYGELPRPVVFLIKREAFHGPIGRAMISLGHIPVRRGVAEREPLRVALDTLAAGGLVGVFPEGTRTSGAVEQVERGVGYLALRAGCPVVPVACVGTERLLPRGSRLPRLRQPVAVSFGPSVDLGAPAGRASRSAIGEATEQIRAELAALVLRTRTTHATVAPGRTGPPVAANRKESR